MTRSTSTVVVGALVVALAATACTGDSAPDPAVTAGTGVAAGSGSPTSSAGSSGRSAMDFVWADGSVLAARTLSLEAAVPAVEGVAFDVLYVTPESVQDGAMVTLALAEDGRLLVTLSPLDNMGDDGWLVSQTPVGIFDGEQFSSFGTSPAPVAGDHPRQAYAGWFSGDVAVWAETDSTDLYASNWRLYSRTNAGPTTTVAYAEQFQEQGPTFVDGDTTPVVSDGRVYFATAASTGDPDVSLGEAGSYQMQTMSSNLDGTDTRIEVPRAAQPAAADGSLFVVRTWRDDPSLTEGQVRIEQADGHGGSTIVLQRDGPADSETMSLVTNGRDIAFVERDADGTASVVVVDTIDHSALRVPLDPDGAEGYASLAMCGDTLTWDNASGDAVEPGVEQYVLNLTTETLRTIAVSDHYPGTYCAGDVIAWSQLASGTSRRATTTVVRWHPED